MCLNGKKVTDKYRCIVSPYNPSLQLGAEDYSVLSSKYKALESIKKKLRYTYTYHDNIVFLTDGEPQSLYPYLVLKDDEKYNKIHLWCMSPWSYEVRKRRNTFFELLLVIVKLTSIHYVDADEFLKTIERRIPMSEVIKRCQEWLNSMLPGALFEIDNKMKRSERYYYDLTAKRYISTDKSYSMILKAKPIKKKDADEFIPVQEFSTLGLIWKPSYPDSDDKVKNVVEQLHPRLDGKHVCEKLKQMRKQLAEVNGVKMNIADCPSTGPCAGTCERCDLELRYLREQLMKVKEEDRVYPHVEITSQNTRTNLLYDEETHVLMGVPVFFRKNANERANVDDEKSILGYLKKRVPKDTKGGDLDE